MHYLKDPSCSEANMEWVYKEIGNAPMNLLWWVSLWKAGSDVPRSAVMKPFIKNYTHLQ